MRKLWTTYIESKLLTKILLGAVIAGAIVRIFAT